MSAVIGCKVYYFGGCTGGWPCEDPSIQSNELFAYQVSDCSTSAWTEISLSGQVPSPRSSHGLAAVGSFLYVFGGFAPPDRKNDLYQIDPASGQCTQLDAAAGVAGTPPSVRRCFGFAAEGTDIYAFGSAQESPAGSNDLHKFDTVARSWEEINDSIGVMGTPPSSRWCLNMVAGNGNLFVAFGMDAEGAYPLAAHRYNIATMTWTELSSASKGREIAAAAFLDSSIYVFGGWNVVDFSNLADFLRLDVGASCSGDVCDWTTISGGGDIPPDRQNAAMSAVGGKVVLFGGAATDGLTNLIHTFNPADSTWTAITDATGTAPSARQKTMSAVIGCKVYYFGGCTGGWPCEDLSIQSNELFAYNVSDCVCPAGFTSDGAGACEACAAGKYKAGSGNEACTECGAGKYSAASGATTCEACTNGTFGVVGGLFHTAL